MDYGNLPKGTTVWLSSEHFGDEQLEMDYNCVEMKIVGKHFAFDKLGFYECCYIVEGVQRGELLVACVDVLSFEKEDWMRSIG